MNFPVYQQDSLISPLSSPDFTSTPTCHSQFNSEDNTSLPAFNSALPQPPEYFTFDQDHWQQPTPPTTPPFFFPSDEQYWTGVVESIPNEQFQPQHSPSFYYQYQLNSLSSGGDITNSLQSCSDIPLSHHTLSLPLTPPSYTGDIGTTSLLPLPHVDDVITSTPDPILTAQDILTTDLCYSSSTSTEPDMFDLIAENSLLITAKEMLTDGLFDDVLEFISTSNPPDRLHEQFQELWTETIYLQASAKRGGKILNAVDRYRLRKRKPFPRNIWNGEHSRHLFRESSRTILQDFYDTNPYPTPEEKRELARKSQLSYSQVSNFFKNRRGRQKGAGHVIPAKRKSAQSHEDARTILEMLQR